jgi:hypothetical protein
MADITGFKIVGFAGQRMPRYGGQCGLQNLGECGVR